jgi:hypothetical protein
MAGYFRKAEEWNYEGAFKAGAVLTNGLVVYIDGANGVKPIAEAGDAEFRVDEKTTLFGLPAVALTCTKTGVKVHYIVENEFEDYGDTMFNTAEYSVPVGHYVKMRRPNINDQVVISVTAEVLATLAVGDIVTPASGGSIVKKS